MQGYPDRTCKQRNYRTSEATEACRSFWTQRCWLCQCIRQPEGKDSSVIHRDLSMELTTKSLGFSRTSSQCAEMLKHVVFLREYPEVSVQP